MARIKDTKKQQTFTLTDQEHAYLKFLQQVRVDSAVSHNKTMSGFLSYIASSRLGYGDVDLQFELDLEDEKKELKITVQQEVQPEQKAAA